MRDMHTVEVTYMLLSWEVTLDDGVIHSARCLGYSDEEVEPGRSIVLEVMENGHPEEWDYPGMPLDAMLSLFRRDLIEAPILRKDLDAVTAWVKTHGSTLQSLENRAHETDAEADAFVRSQVAEWKMEAKRYDR